ncbi:MAG: DUF169 domain-containing protein [bacterium]
MLGDAIRAYLGMKTHIVGVKLIEDEREALHRPGEPMRYCQMVREAAMGKEFTALAEDMACPNSELTLGLRQPKYVDVEPRIKKQVRHVHVFPGLNRDFDVALFVVNPSQVMTIAILLGGMTAEFAGELAVCGETTAQVFNEQKPNVSFLCHGARMFGGFRDNELTVGVPAAKVRDMEELVEMMIKTGGSLCGCLVTDVPREIIRNFKEINFEKGADYFFGEIAGRQVRIYLNKDASGRFKLMTVYVPMKAAPDDVRVSPPFLMKQRGSWLDVYALIDPDKVGINLYMQGEKIARTLESLIRTCIEERRPDANAG